jgi:hypothetical protein
MLVLFDRRTPQVFGAEHSRAIMLSVSEQVKDRKPIVVDNDSLSDSQVD